MCVNDIIPNVSKIEVYYCNDWSSWCVCFKDLDGNIIGESEYYHYKREAVISAREFERHGIELKIFKK